MRAQEKYSFLRGKWRWPGNRGWPGTPRRPTHYTRMKTKSKKMKQIENNMVKITKTRVFWKPCVFNENTHICEKNEGHRDAKSKKKHTCQKDARTHQGSGWPGACHGMILCRSLCGEFCVADMWSVEDWMNVMSKWHVISAGHVLCDWNVNMI